MAHSPGRMGRVRGSRPSRASVAHADEDADEHQPASARRRPLVAGSTFHRSHSTGCAIATAHTEP